MSTSIQVNKKSVKDLLESGKDSSFVIPEYQRTYAWEYDQVETLFDDLWKNDDQLDDDDVMRLIDESFRLTGK